MSQFAGQALSGLFSAGSQSANMFGQMIMTLLANQANEQRYGEGMDLLRNLQAQQVPWIQQLVDQASGQYGQNVGVYQDTMRDVFNNLHATRDRSLQYLEGAGAQERADINTSFAGQQSANRANIVNTGMTGTTVGAGTGAGIERQRSDALGALEERIRQQRLNTDITLSNNIASARERMGQNYFNILDQNIGRNFSMNMIPQDLLRQFEMARLGWIGNRDDIAPDEGIYAQASASLGRGLGLSGVMPPDYPDPPSGIGSGLISGGIGAGTSIATTKILLGCLDLSTKVATPTGPRPMDALREGDSVYTPIGVRRILAIDSGNPHPTRSGDYLKITTDGGCVTLTSDHLIDGSPAGEWQCGDKMLSGRVLSIEAVRPVASGDLIIDGSPSYTLATGSVAASMLSAYGIEAKDLEQMRSAMESAFNGN